MKIKAATATPPAPGKQSSHCWCGHTPLLEYSTDYLRCTKCETLILKRMPGQEVEVITNEDTDLYGRNYYLQHLVNDYGYPDLNDRMRHDLPERCLHWLATLLKHKKPGAKVLELGCSHGASVALFRAAGYDASGLEMSPWLVRFAADTWGAPIQQGTIEQQPIPAGSIDAILLFDVLEHLRNPLDTIRHCVSLLKPEGLLIVQTPRYPEAVAFSELRESSDAFLAQFKPLEHLYLYSNTSARLLMAQAGLSHLVLEPAIFAHYDQYFVASQSAIQLVPESESAAALMATASGRFAAAMLDLRSRVALLQHSQNERNLLQAQFADLQANFSAVEKDRLDRGKLVEQQSQKLTKLESEFDTRLTELNQLYISAEALKNERSLIQAQLADLQANFSAVEKDRLDRGKLVEQQGQRIVELEKLVWLTEQNRDYWKNTNGPTPA